MKSLLTLFCHSVILSIFCFGYCNKPSTEELMPGYVLYDAPNVLDKTGLIFRVTPSGQRLDVGYLNVVPVQGPIEIKTENQTRTMSIKALANFLKVSTSVLKIDANLDLEKKITFRLKLADNTQERLNDLSIDSSLKQIVELIKKDREGMGRDKDKYYLIRESVLTKSMDYGFTKDVTTDAGFNLALDSLIKVNPEVKWNKNNDYQLSFTYKDQRRVFYKAEYLSVLSSITGDITIKRNHLPSDEQIYDTFDRQ